MDLKLCGPIDVDRSKKLWNALDALLEKSGLQLTQGFHGRGEHFTVSVIAKPEIVKTFYVGEHEYWLDTLIRVATWMAKGA